MTTATPRRDLYFTFEFCSYLDRRWRKKKKKEKKNLNFCDRRKQRFFSSFYRVITTVISLCLRELHTAVTAFFLP